MCKRDYAAFAYLENVIPEKDFDENPAEATEKKTLQKQDPIQEQIRKDESYARSMRFNYDASGKASYVL